ncbi:hypothetical protein BB561_000905 [Smittium simulii]|uniref:Glutaredoxin domain-containing protein n=1 Tax=Smittium simulii TaxID=133385 RepID=A0A2T9YX30_9FUNG|nr:hypothetical protein BB561_000905 [Smittium simulii]
MYLRSITKKIIDGGPDFTYQQKLYDLAKSDLDLTSSKERVYLFGEPGSNSVNSIKNILDNYEEVGLIYSMVDSTPYAKRLTHILNKDSPKYNDAFVVLDNQVLGDFTHVSYLNSLEILQETIRYNKLQLNSAQDDQKPAMKLTSKKTADLSTEIENKIKAALKSNGLVAVSSQNSYLSSEFLLIAKKLQSSYNYEYSAHKIDNTVDGDILNSKIYGDIYIPSAFFNNKVYLIDDFVANYNAGKFDSFIFKDSTSTTHSGKNVVDDFINKNTVALFISSDDSNSSSISELFDYYKTAYGLKFNTLARGSKDADFSDILKNLSLKSSDKQTFPSLFVGSEFVGDYKKILKLHYNSNLLSFFQKAKALDQTLLDRAVVTAEKNLESTITNNKFVVISKENDDLDKSILNKIAENFGRQQLASIYLKEKPHSFPIRYLFDKLSIPQKLPILFIDGKIVANGKDNLKKMVKENSLFSSMEKSIVYNKKKLEDLISSSQVMVFSKTYCPFCRKAKTILNLNSINFEVLEIDLLPNPIEIKEHLVEISKGHDTFPSIFVNNKSIGGSSDLEELIKQGKLHEMLNIPKPKSGPPTKQDIIEMINQNKIMMFSKTYCPYCQKAKTILKKNNISFKAFEADLQPNSNEIKMWLAEISAGQTTFPNIFIHGKNIGGSSDLEGLSDSGQLLKMIY